MKPNLLPLYLLNPSLNFELPPLPTIPSVSSSRPDMLPVFPEPADEFETANEELLSSQLTFPQEVMKPAKRIKLERITQETGAQRSRPQASTNEGLLVKVPEGWQCVICNKITKKKCNARRHLTTQHVAPDAKPHKCVLCDKTFRLAHQLKMHLRTHTNERIFECPKCHIRSVVH